MCLKCESGSSRFQPGEGPSRGLLRDYEPKDHLRMELFEALLEVPIPGRPVAGVHGAAVAPLEAELPLDAELGRVRLVLLRPRGRLGTDRCGTGGVS